MYACFPLISALTVCSCQCKSSHEPTIKVMCAEHSECHFLKWKIEILEVQLISPPFSSPADGSNDGHPPTPGAQNTPEVRKQPFNSRYHTSLESSYPPDLHKPSRLEEAVRGRDMDRNRDGAGSDQMDFQGRQFNPHHHHTWSNNHSQSSPRQPSPDNSNNSSNGNKKSRGRKVKKSESESGISKLLKTLRKDSSGKKAAAAEKLRGREISSSSSTLDGRIRLQRRGS